MKGYVLRKQPLEDIQRMGTVQGSMAMTLAILTKRVVIMARDR